jgi:hypothetical protein
LAPYDCYLFLNLKELLEGRKFSSCEEATLAADKWFAAQPKEMFLDGLKILKQPRHKCLWNSKYIFFQHQTYILHISF